MIDILRLLAHEGEDRYARRVTVQHCTVPGCGQASKGKPWCSAHVLSHSPYAIEVHEEVCRREEASKGGTRYTQSMLEEAASVVEAKGRVTIRYLCRAMGVSRPVAEKLANRLVREGLARVAWMRGRMAVEAR